jgi:3-hydroxyisobutyrate dehydrogenase-like beta-hydroxyacid dehydrogenase
MARRVGIVSIGIMGTAMMCNLVKDGFAQGAMARSAEAGGSPPPRRATSPKRPRF